MELICTEDVWLTDQTSLSGRTKTMQKGKVYHALEVVRDGFQDDPYKMRRLIAITNDIGYEHFIKNCENDELDAFYKRHFAPYPLTENQNSAM